MTTPKNKDRSMLYAALIGFALFVLVPALLVVSFLYTYSPAPPFFPEGSQIDRRSTLGWPGTGASVTIGNIPPEASEEFEQKLRERGFVETPISEPVPRQDSLDKLDAPLAVTNGLWLIDKEPEDPYDYVSCTLRVYDLDTCTYYSVTYDY